MSVSSQSSSGVIVDSGNFDWNLHKKRFPQFTEPSPGFHGMNIWGKFGKLSFIVLARAAVLRDIGPCLNPFTAADLIAGLETLVIRIQRHSSNALALAKWLVGQDNVEWVSYPGICPITYSCGMMLLTFERPLKLSIISAK
jgi:O-acetylhomoserine/O-acetylserine sulfhydrylase